MPDRQPFIPHQPEKIVTCEITKREAVLIQELRTMHFGKLLVHKVNGIIVRLEPQSSTLITGDEEITITSR